MGQLAADRNDFPVVLALGASILIWLVLQVWGMPWPGTVTLADLAIFPDDAMRLVQARDLADGRGWRELTQPRLGAEDALPMHWSRLVDAPLAALMQGFEPSLGRAQAVLASALIWSLAVGFTMIALTLLLALRFLGVWGMAAAALLLALNALTNVDFARGRVDHHGVQVALVLAMGLLVLWGGSWRAALSAVVMSVSLGIGLESLPLLAAIAAIVAGRWVVLDARAEAVSFNLTLLLALPLMLWATVPPDQVWTAWCDALSVTFVAAISAGAGTVGLAALILNRPALLPRLLAMTLAAAVAMAVFLAVNPACLAGPYTHLDPETIRALGTIVETKSVLALISESSPELQSVTLIPALGALGVGLAAMSSKGAARAAWIGLGVLLALAWLVALAQIRGARFLQPFALIGIAWLLVRIFTWRGAVLQFLKPVALLAVVLAATPLTGRVLASPPPQHATTETTGLVDAIRACTGAEQMAALAALPKGRVAAPQAIGSFVLLLTDHWSLSSAHHRNYAGNLASFHMDAADDERLFDLAEEWRITYFVLCHNSAAKRSYGPGRVLLEARGGVEWLAPLPSTEPLRIYRVLPRNDAD